MKNSREEDIKLLEEFSNENVLYGSTVGMTLEKYKDLQLSTEHILSDYKRVLKENESLKEYNMEYKRILDLADDRIYRKKYLEERRKEQPTLLYPDGDEIYQRYYELKQQIKESQRENEELEEINNELEAEKNEAIRRYNFETIPIKKVKDKIEKLNKIEQDLQNSISKEEREEYSDTNISWNLMDINIRREELQELLEGRK